MKKINAFTKLAIIGGGPMALMLVRRLLDNFQGNLQIELFEKERNLGSGMPYSKLGAQEEHFANISASELPDTLSRMEDWLADVGESKSEKFSVKKVDFNKLKALPRLLLGYYLSDEFDKLLDECKSKGFTVNIHYRCAVLDIIDDPAGKRITIVHEEGRTDFDKAVICSGHFWPKKKEGIIPNYFDSPYPPAKLRGLNNYPVAIRGASLTAIDAIRTLARNNGYFYRIKDGQLRYRLFPASNNFKLIMHSRNGLLPAVRFHLEDEYLGRSELLSFEEIERIKADNAGFVPLNYLYKHVFLNRIKTERPNFHKKIEELTMEDFVEKMLGFREDIDPFVLLALEYKEAARSIRERKSIYWKEMLAVLSYTMNYPAKYFSAEDMLRLQRTLKPLISIVIAFVPQQSVEELLALHAAKVLSLVEVGDDSEVEDLQNGGICYHYKNSAGEECHDCYAMFVDCRGQLTFSIDELPFKSLKSSETVAPAMLKFKNNAAGEAAQRDSVKGVGKAKDGNYYMQLPGVAINDNFQVTDIFGKINERIYMLAVPFIGGFNPDYSGLDFTEEASLRVARSLSSS